MHHHRGSFMKIKSVQIKNSDIQSGTIDLVFTGQFL